MLNKCTCAMPTLSRWTHKVPQKVFLKIYSISILRCLSPVNDARKIPIFFETKHSIGKARFSPILLLAFARRNLLFLSRVFFFFEMAEMEDSAFLLLELFIHRLDFNCYLVLFQIGMANKETNLELSVLFSLSWAVCDEADTARRKGFS